MFYKNALYTFTVIIINSVCKSYFESLNVYYGNNFVCGDISVFCYFFTCGISANFMKSYMSLAEVT